MEAAETAVQITVSDGTQLEARVFRPRPNPLADVAIIATHPYGPLGGDLYNNIVASVTEHFARQGCTTLRFNFRGVGNSSGRTSWTAAGEEEDMKAVCRYVLDEMPGSRPKQVLLVGYSYGSVVASSIAASLEAENRLLALVTIGYPYSVLWFLTLFNSSRCLEGLAALKTTPKLFLIGTRDNFTSVSSFEKLVEKHVKEPKQARTITDEDHFFFGNEHKLLVQMDTWLKKEFPDKFT